jgi:hypothetical protein
MMLAVMCRSVAPPEGITPGGSSIGDCCRTTA